MGAVHIHVCSRMCVWTIEKTDNMKSLNPLALKFKFVPYPPVPKFKMAAHMKSIAHYFFALSDHLLHPNDNVSGG